MYRSGANQLAWTLNPNIVRRWTNAHDVEHDTYGIVLTVTFDKAEYYFISFAKQALVDLGH
jgi:hypothetical protein